MMRDADFGVVRLRAYGTYDFRIVDVPRFLKEVAGTDHHFRLDEFTDVDALAPRQRVLRRAREREDSRARRRVALRRARRGAAAADQPGRWPRSTACEMTHVRRRERLGAARSRAGDRQALEHGGGRQPERLREVPDGAGLREGRRRRRRRRRRDGRRHGDGAADDEPAGRHHGAVDAGHRAARRRRRGAPSS